jgi:CMP-2-keto-3-deoxyoctulosonic acid synthetase
MHKNLQGDRPTIEADTVDRFVRDSSVELVEIHPSCL